MEIDYSKYMETRIDHAKSILDSLNEDETNPAILLANINGIRSIIFEILDYTINHFPGYHGESKKIYFPILNFRDEIEYLYEHRHYKLANAIIGGNISTFLKCSYAIIIDPKYDRCLLLLNPSLKHRNIDEILETKPDLKVEATGNGIQTDIFGGLDIKGFIQAPANANIIVKNCIIIGPDDCTVIDSLETIEVQGASLLIDTGTEKIRVKIKPFLEKCIRCCFEILKLWESISV